VPEFSRGLNASHHETQALWRRLVRRQNPGDLAMMQDQDAISHTEEFIKVE
jgi:hypothetical protein